MGLDVNKIGQEVNSLLSGSSKKVAKQITEIPAKDPAKCSEKIEKTLTTIGEQNRLFLENIKITDLGALKKIGK